MSARKSSIRKLETIPPTLIETIVSRLRDSRRVRRSLPTWGRIHIDRPLPFLCVYRNPATGQDPDTERLATSEASYLICSGKRKLQPGLTELIKSVASVLTDQFGSCLLLELWAGPPPQTNGPFSTAELTPTFRIVAPRSPDQDIMTDEFQQALSRIRLGKRRAKVSATHSSRCAPPRLPPLLNQHDAREIGCHLYGLEITPIYRTESGEEIFPGVLRELRHRLTVALRRSFFEFARSHTTHRPRHYHALGRNAVVKAVWEVDRLLAAASDQFDFLLQLTPVNSEAAWQEFKNSRFERRPVFHYRPLPTEPVVLKRNLFKAPVERVEDPALAQIFREKLDEMDRQITMLTDRNTSRFRHGSIQLYGDIDESLTHLALDILEQVPSRSRDENTRRTISPQEFADRAREEIAYLKKGLPSLSATVEVRSDVSSLMVSRGNLLVSTQSRIPESRVESLIQHEVGTHVLTYHNGRTQRFQQLYAGLAGYDELQEGLAVLTEYLSGGLSKPRVRMLAARVIAARAMLDGATFVETFRELDRRYDFAKRTAFNIVMRIFRGGGLTKDAVYLRGLVQILKYLGGGGELEPLLVGKIATQHIPIVRELQWRGVLRDPPLTPRYLSLPAALERLERVRKGASVLELIDLKPRPRGSNAKSTRYGTTVMGGLPAAAAGTEVQSAREEPIAE